MPGAVDPALDSFEKQRASVSSQAGQSAASGGVSSSSKAESKVPASGSSSGLLMPRKTPGPEQLSQQAASGSSADAEGSATATSGTSGKRPQSSSGSVMYPPGSSDSDHSDSEQAKAQRFRKSSPDIPKRGPYKPEKVINL